MRTDVQHVRRIARPPDAPADRHRPAFADRRPAGMPAAIRAATVRYAASRSRPRVHRPPPTRGHRRTRHRSEEHTSELQSLMRISYAVFCLKKKKKIKTSK